MGDLMKANLMADLMSFAHAISIHLSHKLGSHKAVLDINKNKS